MRKDLCVFAVPTVKEENVKTLCASFIVFTKALFYSAFLNHSYCLGAGGQQMDESAALRTYCKKQIQHLNHRKHSFEYRAKQRKTKCMTIKITEPISDHSVPKRLICTLRLKAFREELRKGAEQDFHDPSQCTACLAKRADLAQDLFIREKKTQLQARQLEDKIQLCLYKDSVCLLGEILRNMPKPSDEPGEIWQKLKAREKTLHDNK